MRTGNLLLFGCDFLPRRQTNELAFWQDSIPYLREHFDDYADYCCSNKRLLPFIY